MNRTAQPVVAPIYLKNVEAMCEESDPHFIEEEHLSQIVEDYLLDTVEPTSLASPVVIELHFEKYKKGDSELAAKIIRNHFSQRVDNAIKRKRKDMKRWWFNLAIGLVFLAACIGASRLLSMVKEKWLANLLEESSVIIGWVALWEPVSHLLYGWTENADLFTACLRLRNADIVRSADIGSQEADS